MLERIDALTDDCRTIGVTGTHGRGTVTAMVAWILDCAGWEPAFAVSAVSNNFGDRRREIGGDWAVLELNEEAVASEAVMCDYMVCNFLELPSETKDDGEDIKASMRRMLESNRRLKEAFVNLDCLGNRQLVEGLALRPTGYALEHQAEFRGELEDVGKSGLVFRAAHRDRQLGHFELEIPGSYHAINALGAIAVTRRLGISSAVIAEALASFRGLENRYTVAGGGGVTIVKDLASRPSAMTDVVDTARRGLEGRLYCVVEGARLLRDAVSTSELGAALSRCDDVTLTQAAVSAAPDGERPLEAYGDELEARSVASGVRTDEEAGSYVEDRVQVGDTVLYFGDDDFLRTADHLRANLASEAAQTPEAKEQPRFDGPLIDGDD